MASKHFALYLTHDELAALKASLFHRLDEMASLSPTDAEGLRVLMERAERMGKTGAAQWFGGAHHKMELSPDELALLNQHIWHSFGLRGYIVGRPGALTALASLQRKLAHLKEVEAKPSLLTRLLNILQKR